MRRALLISADPASSASIIRALESEHDIWHVARHRDAMAWLKQHRPQTVIIDLDLDGLELVSLLDNLEEIGNEYLLIIGISDDPTRLAPAITSRIDQLIHR